MATTMASFVYAAILDDRLFLYRSLMIAIPLRFLSRSNRLAEGGRQELMYSLDGQNVCGVRLGPSEIVIHTYYTLDLSGE